MINLQLSLGPGITSLDKDFFDVLGQGNRRQPALPQGDVDPGEETELTLAYISFLFLSFHTDKITCPVSAIGNNTFPALGPIERKQYENSNKWYLNISWYPVSGR